MPPAASDQVPAASADEDPFAATAETRATSELEYRRQVTRYRRGSLLQLIAAAAAQHSGPHNPQGWLELAARQYTPWALADVARVSLAAARRPGRARVAATVADLDHLLAMHDNLDDPARASSEADLEPEVMNYMLRTAAEQFPFQHSPYRAAARSAAVLLHTPRSEGNPAQCITAGWEQELLGCALADYVAAARILWGSAVYNQGRFEMAFIQGPDADPRLGFLDPEAVRRTLDAHFAVCVTDFPKLDREAAGTASRDRRLRRYTYNPLAGRPAVTGLGPDYLCPIPQLAWAKATLAGLYYTGVAHYGSRFADELGDLVEQYVGAQLRLIEGAGVIPEITYRHQRNNVRAVDWVVLLDDVVVLIEVKSAAPTAENRLAGPDAWEGAKQNIGKAFAQIERTAARITERHPAFREIPHDRHILGLVVTREPFYTANWPSANRFFPRTSVPTAVGCLDELEAIVTLTDIPVGTFLNEIAEDPLRHTYDLFTSLRGHTFRPNPVLDRGWGSLRWKPAEFGGANEGAAV